MKRKRAVEIAENSLEATKAKKQRSQTKISDESSSYVLNNTNGKSPGTSFQSVLKNPRKQRSKTVSSNTKFVESESSRGRKKRKCKDINKNGDIAQDTHSAASGTSKKSKNNGLYTKLVDESVSEASKKQSKNSKRQILEKVDESSILTPIRKKPGRKRKVIGEMKLTKTSPNDDITKDNSTTRHGVLKKSIRNKQIPTSDQSVDIDITEAAQKKIKKKVRIDETESLKIKKEIAESEPHFSVKELPAKIIKSKSNKNLTEEVKVSPLTVQDLKKEIMSFEEIKVENEEIEVGQQHIPMICYVKEEDDKDILRKEIKLENVKFEDGEFEGVKLEDVKFEDVLGAEHVENSVDNEYDTTSEESDLEVYYINKNAEKEARKRSPKRYSILMPKEDQLILVQRMQEVIPEGDTKSYKYRLQHLEWQKVAFKNYSLEECQKVWAQLLKKVRHYRLLVEITHDVKNVIELNDLQATKPRKTKATVKKHPDMPKRPLTSYFLYYIRKRNKMCKERPDLDTVELNKYISEMYQNLPLEKKQKYEVLAVKNREKYKEQLEEFYAKHPEMRKVVIKRERQKKEKPPKRPENPYKLFVHSELNREEIADEDKSEFNEVCKEKWRQMSDSKKLEWINLAEEHHKKYEEELKEYMAKHPEYTPKRQPHKTILSRQELNLKDKLAGKPKKPPGTAYGLFLSMTMQSNETADLPPRERWNYASVKWKAMSDEEREQHKQLLIKAHEQYEKDFKVYLDSLPEDKRQAEILNNLPKKRKNAAADKSANRTAKTKGNTTKAQSSKGNKMKKEKLENPVLPPRSTYRYFAEKYGGENPKEAWRNLSSSEKEAYEEELNVIKEKYIKDFEAYLKSLTKEELALYCATRIIQSTSSSEDGDSDSEHNEDSSDVTSDSDSEDEFEEN